MNKAQQVFTFYREVLIDSWHHDRNMIEPMADASFINAIKNYTSIEFLRANNIKNPEILHISLFYFSRLTEHYRHSKGDFIIVITKHTDYGLKKMIDCLYSNLNIDIQGAQLLEIIIKSENKYPETCLIMTICESKIRNSNYNIGGSHLPIVYRELSVLISKEIEKMNIDCVIDATIYNDLDKSKLPFASQTFRDNFLHKTIILPQDYKYIKEKQFHQYIKILKKIIVHTSSDILNNELSRVIKYCEAYRHICCLYDIDSDIELDVIDSIFNIFYLTRQNIDLLIMLDEYRILHSKNTTPIKKYRRTYPKVLCTSLYNLPKCKREACRAGINAPYKLYYMPEYIPKDILSKINNVNKFSPDKKIFLPVEFSDPIKAVLYPHGHSSTLINLKSFVFIFILSSIIGNNASIIFGNNTYYNALYFFVYNIDLEIRLVLCNVIKEIISNIGIDVIDTFKKSQIIKICNKKMNVCVLDNVFQRSSFLNHATRWSASYNECFDYIFVKNKHRYKFNPSNNICVFNDEYDKLFKYSPFFDRGYLNKSHFINASLECGDKYDESRIQKIVIEFDMLRLYFDKFNKFVQHNIDSFPLQKWHDANIDDIIRRIKNDYNKSLQRKLNEHKDSFLSLLIIFSSLLSFENKSSTIYVSTHAIDMTEDIYRKILDSTATLLSNSQISPIFRCVNTIKSNLAKNQLHHVDHRALERIIGRNHAKELLNVAVEYLINDKILTRTTPLYKKLKGRQSSPLYLVNLRILDNFADNAADRDLFSDFI